MAKTTKVRPAWMDLEPGERVCCLCHQPARYDDPLDKHHVFGGSRRKASEEDGLVVLLHHFSCHESGPKAVHRNAETDRKLKRAAQKAWMAYEEGRTVEDFRLRYGKSYL